MESSSAPLVDEETNRPMYRPLRDKMLLQIFLVPNFMEMLNQQEVVEELSREAAKDIGKMTVNKVLKPTMSLLISTLSS